MNRYLLDTGTVSDFINCRRGVDVRVREIRRQGARIGTCMPVLAELFYGIELSASRDANRKRLLHGLSSLACWPFDRRAAEIFGRVAAELRRAGTTIQSIDIQIAAIALSLGSCTIVTADSDFAAIRGLPIENWAT